MSLKTLSIVFFILFINKVSANDMSQDIANSFAKGDYDKVEMLLKTLKKNSINLAKIYYYKGLIQNRKEAYETGAQYLKKSLKYGDFFEDIYYELGQAYYAINNLELSEKAFAISYKNNIKTTVCLYYLAHINQIQEQYDKSIDYYQKLIEHKEVKPDIKQVAMFQMAEAELASVTEDDKRQKAKSTSIPLLKDATLVLPESAVNTEISKRIAELENKYRLNSNVLINGKKAPPRSEYRFTQSMVYDNNVTYANELPTVITTQQDSFIFETSFMMSNNFIFDQRFILRPDITLNFTKHSNQDNSSVYQYDQYSIYPELNLDTEFTFLNAPATFNLFANNYYSARDHEQNHTLKEAGNSLSYGASFKLKLINAGYTTIKYGLSSSTSYDETLNSTGTNLSVGQFYSLGLSKLLILNFMQTSTVVENEQYSTDSNIYSLDYLLLESIPSINIQFGTTVTIQDLVNDSSRGKETTIALRAKATKKIDQNLRYSVSYEYTDKSSENDSYVYDKEAVTFQLKLNY